LNIRAVTIHASRAGRDLELTPLPGNTKLFQSTRPVRYATLRQASLSRNFCFNPRVPCGTRLK